MSPWQKKVFHVNNEVALHPANRITSWVRYISLPALLWIAVWLGINTGPWVFKQTPDNLLDWLNYFRTVFPTAVLFIAYIVMAERGDFGKKIINGPVKLWLIYGLISLGICIKSPKPLDAAYWAVNYLSVFAVMAIFLLGENKLAKVVRLNYLSWIVTAFFLCILVLVARDVLFVDYRYGWLTGYGIIHRMDTVGNVTMSRSSGMARFAAVPGIVTFVLLLTGSSWKRILWIIPFVLSAVLIWFMQSRGAILGLAFSMAFVTIFLGTRSRIVGFIGLISIVLLYFTDFIPDRAERYIKKHFYRGQTQEELLTLTGRTRAWKKAWLQIEKTPIFGRGPQSDRYLIKTHVHNTYLYALLQAGMVGATAFVGGLVWAWVLFFRAILRKTADQLGQRVILIQTGGILAFFTVRSIPEVCGAMFGVDLMVMVPALAYLTLLDREDIEKRSEGETVRSSDNTIRSEDKRIRR